MTKIISKNQQWFLDNMIKEFRTKKYIKKYLIETESQLWKKIDVNQLPDKITKICEVQNKSDIDNFYEFYESSLNNLLIVHLDSYGVIYNFSISEYIKNYNIIDSQNNPLIVNYFKKYINKSSDISLLYDMALDRFSFERISKKNDLKKMNEWAFNQRQNMITPEYFFEENYALLIVIIGEFIISNKLEEFSWAIKKTRTEFFDDGRTNVEFVYNPYLFNCNKNIIIDIVQAFREYLFYERGNFKNVFTNIYNNIEKYKVV